jgi:flagella basal body P-ring formation protein FlgA
MCRARASTTRVLAALAIGLALARAGVAQAGEATLPVPNVVIYPGDIIRDNMLTDVPAGQVQDAAGTIVDSRDALVGKLAKRTLLPGRAILTIAVGTPRAVKNGAEVTLFYQEGGLTIVAEGSALQDGSVGDVIKVRNVDSGVTVSGAVQSDGSVRVGGG